MNFDDLQKAWQAQDRGTKVIIDTDVLLKEVRRNQQQFRATILLRDMREAVVAFGLAIYFLRHGSHTHWPDVVVALACAGVVAFLIVDRLLHRGQRPNTNDPLKECVESSRREVQHQIWLLRNVWWWYLLPLAVGVNVSVTGNMVRLMPKFALAFGCVYFVFCLAVYWGIYWLNQRAVRKSLQPRLEELDALLADLK